MNSPVKTKPVDAALRALKILKVFNHRTPQLTLSQISQQCGMVKSTTLRMLLSLVEEGFITVDIDKRYMLGPEVFRLGSCYAGSFELEPHIRPVMKTLVEQTGECVSFFQRVGDKRMCLFRENSHQVLREHVAEGDTVVLDRGAAGRVLLDFAGFNGDHRSQPGILDSLPYVSHGERDAGIGGLAAPVFSGFKGLLGAITISGPVSRLTPERIRELRKSVFSAAAQISAELGARFYVGSQGPSPWHQLPTAIAQASAVSYTASHWGLYEVDAPNTPQARIRPYVGDPDPSAIGLYLNHPEVEALRVQKPAIRRGWLEKRAGLQGAARGGDQYVEVEWDQALKLVAEELARVKREQGNKAIFGGSYGWASAGRFHHAQSQIHRFLNSIGGYVRHVDSYSLGAARALMPWLVAPMDELMSNHTDWQTLAENTEIFLSFGGVPAKNAQIAVGGTAEHRVKAGLYGLHQAGVRVINVSPVKDDIDTGGPVEWWAIRPNTDTALLLGLAHTLRIKGLQDSAFLDRYCTGYEVFERYLMGRQDGQPKSAAWAAGITGLAAREIEALAVALASKRTMINMAWSLQRAHHGEQPYWALVSLAAMLGQIGLPGGGFAMCYGAENLMGSRHRRLFGPTLSQGNNAVEAFIPVARVADMLLNPGDSFTYQGKTHTYPDIRLVYWAGGNPFHHHQDLPRLIKAWQRPETIIVHEQYWTAAAKMADIVLPATTSFERDDIFYAAREPVIAAMQQAQQPCGEARDDYTIFADLSRRLGAEALFTEGLDVGGWLKKLYNEWREKLAIRSEVKLPEFDRFWKQGLVELKQQGEAVILLEDFRNDPETNPLKTPSGRIEIFSRSIAEFDLPDCPGYACWQEPHEWLGSPLAKQFPLHLISDQPKNKLHSQLDHSPHSRKDKIQGREPLWLNDNDASARGLVYGDLVRVFNQRGACLAAAVPSPDIRPGVARLSTGAWLDPLNWQQQEGELMLDKHGNPNILTADVPASAFSQGCSAQTCLVQVERWRGDVPEMTAYQLPIMESDSSS